MMNEEIYSHETVVFNFRKICETIKSSRHVFLNPEYRCDEISLRCDSYRVEFLSR